MILSEEPSLADVSYETLKFSDWTVGTEVQCLRLDFNYCDNYGYCGNCWIFSEPSQKLWQCPNQDLCVLAQLPLDINVK